MRQNGRQVVQDRTLQSTLGRFRLALPKGRTLPDDEWRRRHRWLLALLWAHVFGLPIFGIARGYGLAHSLLEGLVLAAIATAATVAGRRKRTAAALVSLGMVTSSAILVHLSGGVIEAHFHFFVVIVVLSLYEDWLPFLLAAAYVVVHHGLTGALDPDSVYNHPDAIEHPWKWAAIHGGFVAGAGIGSVLAWRLNEDVRAQSRQAYAEARASERRLEAAHREVVAANAALQEGEEARRYLGAIVESSDDAIVGKDLSGRILSWNPAAERLYGYSSEEAIGQSVEMLLPADRSDEVQEILARVREGEPIDHLDTVRVRKDGTAVPVSLTVSPIKDSTGRVVGASAIARDVGERKEAEEELQRAHAALALAARERQVILESIGEGIVSVDRNGLTTFANRAAQALLGWSEEELVGRLQHDAIHHTRADGTAYPREECPIYSVLSRGEVARCDAEVFWRKDGSSFPVEYVSAPLRDEEGDIVGAVLAFQDIAERKRVEAELQAARDEALEATRRKSEFLANMSHEIRTPMNGVIGMTELLLDTKLTPEQHQYAETVQASGATLLSIINDILDFSKIEAGKLELHMTSFPLEEVVEDVADLLANRADKKGVELTALVEDAVPPTLCGDEARIRQVLMNLVSNAIKFTERGEVHVRATVEGWDGDDAHVRLVVSDTGIGIDPDHADRLFETFEQADTSTTRRFGGTGLGLTISKQLVEMMGGRIGATGALGEGSTFWFSVPLAVDRHEPARDDDHSRAEALHGRRLLIVDDNETSRRITAHHASAWGMETQEAADGQTALAMLRSATAEGRPIEIVALDMHMPGMDGLEVARRARADAGIDRAQMFLLSSASERPENLAGAGLDAYAAKPVRRARLRRTLLQLVGDAQHAASEPEPQETGFDRSLRREVPVLVAEDNEVNRVVAVRLLEKLGCRVGVASDGREAVAMFERGDYRAILMDCQMPELDGYHATAEIRRRGERGAHVPIIALTAQTMQGDRDRCLAAGMSDYISKPVTADALAAVLSRHVAFDFDSEEATTSEHGAGNDQRAGSTQPPVFESSQLEQISGGDDEVQRQLIDLFLEQGTAGITELGDAISLQELTTVRRVAHSLKGSAATVGAIRMSELCSRITDAGRCGEMNELTGLHARLQSVFQETAAALRNSLDACHAGSVIGTTRGRG